MTVRSARLILVLLGCAPIQTTFADQLDDIVNYREYSATLSSSGQPDMDQLGYLREAGFERVVYLAFSDCPSSNKWNRRSDLLMESFVPYGHVTRRVVDSANDVSRWSFA
jgi:hypothetical protein